MSAYRDALNIQQAESGERLRLAEELISQAKEVVLLDQLIAFRPMRGELICEVISSRGRTEEEYLNEVAEAKRHAALSTIWPLVSNMKQHWLVVDDYGTGTIELCRVS